MVPPDATPLHGSSPWTPGIPVLERRDSLMPQLGPSPSHLRAVSLQVLNPDDAVSRIVYEVDVPPAPAPGVGGARRARGDSVGEAPPRSSAFARPITLLLARLTILIQRSSGRDKISALIQYGSLALSDAAVSGGMRAVFGGLARRLHLIKSHCADYDKMHAR